MLTTILLALAGIILMHASDATPCHEYVLINVRGTTEHQGPSIAFVNMTANTIAKIPNGTEYDLVYPASTASNSEALGYKTLTTYINHGLASCPSQRYAILGYSQGALVTELALRSFAVESKGFNAIAAVVLVGNPGHKPFQSANIDEFGLMITNEYIGSLYNLGVRVPTFWYQSTKVLDVCHTGDVVCALSYPNGSFLDHLRYGSNSKVQTMGTAFLVSSLTAEIRGSGADFMY